MDNTEPVIVYTLPPEKAQHNARTGLVETYHVKTQKHVVAFPDGSKEQFAKHNLFFASRRDAYFATQHEQLRPLEDFSAVQLGPYGHDLVATADIPAGILLRTTTLDVCMTRGEIAQIEAEFEAFLHRDLFRLMGKPPKSSTIIFDTNYTPALVFIGAVAQLTEHPIIKELMRYDCFAHECLTLELRRGSGPDRIWLKFWIDKLTQLGRSPKEVYRLYHLTRNLSWSSPDRDMLIFDILLYCANTPNKRWEEYEKVMEGLQDNSVDIYSDQYLSTFMMSPPNKVKDMKVYFMIAVKKGDLIELDYALAYVSDRCDTVLNILNMNTTDGALFQVVRQHHQERESQSARALPRIHRAQSRALQARQAACERAHDVVGAPAHHVHLCQDQPAPLRQRGLPQAHGVSLRLRQVQDRQVLRQGLPDRRVEGGAQDRVQDRRRQVDKFTSSS